MIKINEMKKISIGFFLLMGFMTTSAQSILINGNLKNIPDSTVVTLLDGILNKEVATDKVMGGKFNLKASTEFPSVFVLGFANMPIKLPIFISNDAMTIDGDINAPNLIKYTGSMTHQIYQSYMGVINPKMENYFKTMTIGQAEKEMKLKDSLSKLADAQSADIISTYEGLSKLNNQTPVTTFFLFQFANIFPSVKENLAGYYGKLTGAAKKGPFAEIIDKTLQSIQLGAIGSIMPEFKQNDVNGKSVSLSSFKGKYVLIDFWASWCGPCRGENPNVVRAYNEFKDKKFTVLGISLDQDKNKWLEAIKNDKLTWTHLSDLKYWQNAVAVQFGIQSIPANFLIDPTGKIVAKDLRGEALINFLKNNLK